VRRAAARSGLEDLFGEAAADVERALEALRSAGLIPAEGRDVQLEYPVAGAWEGGALLTGYLDLVAATAERLDVIDFKTDPPPREPIERAYPQYASQVRLYGRLLAATGVVGGRAPRYGLLFTADGTIRWVDEATFDT
jgi:ATP-dependent exoDNAse (exonuclease V) beta subunit